MYTPGWLSIRQPSAWLSGYYRSAEPSARPLIVVRMARLGRTYNRDLLGQLGAHFAMSNRVWKARASYICVCIMMNRQRERG
jgi:hypothetical protein